MATFDVNLPGDDELTVPEVNLSSPALRAGAFHMGKYCENHNNVSILVLSYWSLHHQLNIKTNETWWIVGVYVMSSRVG